MSLYLPSKHNPAILRTLSEPVTAPISPDDFAAVVAFLQVSFSRFGELLGQVLPEFGEDLAKGRAGVHRYTRTPEEGGYAVRLEIAVATRLILAQAVANSKANIHYPSRLALRDLRAATHKATKALLPHTARLTFSMQNEAEKETAEA